MKYPKCFLLVLGVLVVSACDSTSFESTWHDPSAASMDLRQKEAAAFLLSRNEAVRRSFEANLADQLTRRGIETLPGYQVLPDGDVTNQDEILRKLRNTTVDVAIFMRIVDREQEISYFPGDYWYPGPYYDPFLWRHGAYYGPGFVGGWPYYDPGYYRVDTIVSVETLVYSVPQGKLVWTGLSKTMNPSKVDKFVKDLVSATVKKLEQTGLVDKEA